MDVSAVVEEVVDGLVLGHTYTSGIDLTDMTRESRGRGKTLQSGNQYSDLVKINLDIQKADWTFLTQPGAVRRIIMNLTGNAIKYTNRGSIDVRLQLQDAQDETGGELMVLTVRDTGKGNLTGVLEQQTFCPFCSGECFGTWDRPWVEHCPQHCSHARRDNRCQKQTTRRYYCKGRVACQEAHAWTDLDSDHALLRRPQLAQCPLAGLVQTTPRSC